MTKAGALSARVLRERTISEALSSPWRALAEQRCSPFTSPEWFEAALATIDADREPAAVVVSDLDGKLVGVLPLVVDARGRTLTFAGSHSADRLHPASARHDERAVAMAAGAAIASEFPSWREVRLRNVEPAPWTAALGEGLGRAAIQALPPVRLPYAEIEGLDRDSYLATRSRSFRSQAGRRLRGLCREHAVAVRMDVAPRRVEQSLESVLRLHAARWDARSGVSSLGADRVLDFHRDFAIRAARRGWTRILLLEADGDAVAGWYGWAIGDRWLYYQAGFDPGWASHSVGTLLMVETLAAATASGACEYDLLQGDEDFKFRFADHERYATTIVVTRAVGLARARARLGALARLLWRRLPERRRDAVLERLAARGRRRR